MSSTIVAVADPTSEAHVPKSSEAEVAAETKFGDGGGEGEGGAEVARETTVPQVASVPTPTTEAAPESAKDVTAGDTEGPVNGTLATVDSDPFPLPTSEGNARTSMDTTSTKRSSSTEGEGFASDATWEDRTWKEVMRLKEDMFWARIGGIRALQG